MADPKSPKNKSREERLAEALRANLRKRKAQARAKSSQPITDKPSAVKGPEKQ